MSSQVKNPKLNSQTKLRMHYDMLTHVCNWNRAPSFGSQQPSAAGDEHEQQGGEVAALEQNTQGEAAQPSEGAAPVVSITRSLRSISRAISATVSGEPLPLAGPSRHVCLR